MVKWTHRDNQNAIWQTEIFVFRRPKNCFLSATHFRRFHHFEQNWSTSKKYLSQTSPNRLLLCRDSRVATPRRIVCRISTIKSKRARMNIAGCRKRAKKRKCPEKTHLAKLIVRALSIYFSSLSFEIWQNRWFVSRLSINVPAWKWRLYHKSIVRDLPIFRFMFWLSSTHNHIHELSIRQSYVSRKIEDRKRLPKKKNKWRHDDMKKWNIRDTIMTTYSTIRRWRKTISLWKPKILQDQSTVFWSQSTLNPMITGNRKEKQSRQQSDLTRKRKKRRIAKKKSENKMWDRKV